MAIAIIKKRNPRVICNENIIKNNIHFIIFTLPNSQYSNVAAGKQYENIDMKPIGVVVFSETPPLPSKPNVSEYKILFPLT